MVFLKKFKIKTDTTTPTCLQVNPLAETKDGKLIAADAKLGFDDNAAFRQKELFSLRDTTQEDPRSVTAACIPSA